MDYCRYSFLKSAQTMQENSVAHRDLKLSNMINSDGDVFIVDYGTVNQNKEDETTQKVAGTPGVNISFEAMEVMDSLPDDLPEEISKLDINEIIKNEETLQRFIEDDLPKVKKEKPLSYKSLLYFLHATIVNNEAREKMYRTAKDLTVLELNFKAKLKQLGSNNNKLEIMQKRNEFKDKKSDLEQERKKYEEKLFTSQVKTIQEEYNKFEIPEEYKFSEIDSEKYAIGLTALSLMNFNIKKRLGIGTKKVESEKSPLLKSLEELSKKNQKSSSGI